MLRSKRFAPFASKISVFCIAFVAALDAAVAAEIKVVGGSAVIPVMEILIPQFERASGHKVVADFDGAIGAMAKRIEGGEAADVVIVSGQQIESLEKSGRVVPKTAADLGRLGVGVFVRKGAARPDIGSVDAFKRALLAAKSISYNDPAAGAPVSLYLRGAFERLGIGREMAAKTVVFKQRSERFAAVARGDVEIGFNQISEILAVPEVDLVGPLPKDIQSYTHFAAAVVAAGRQPGAAREFIAFITAPPAVALMRAKGFE
jgi:molybdate transport system substrate-binding protein